jgi:glutamate racemase
MTSLRLRSARFCSLLLIVLGSADLLPVFGQHSPGGSSEPLPGADRVAARVRDVYASCDSGSRRHDLPIGVFDSGTGGLAVLEAILRLDAFDNRQHTPLRTGDRLPDFQSERFVFLADQVNMPYGNYPSLGKVRFLRELVLKDAEFLLSAEYWPAPAAPAPRRNRRPVKAIVIACNTATAYGYRDIAGVLAQAGVDLPVIGVIGAGAQAALGGLGPTTEGTIGVLATAGTVASGAYPAAIQTLARQHGTSHRIEVIQQGSVGLAGAIDEAREFVVRVSDGHAPRPDYRGPASGHPQAPLDCRLLPRYGFDFSAGKMLFSGSPAEPSCLQLNAVDNYVAYELVSLLETLRARGTNRPLRAVILGCTHFPYVADAIRAHWKRLYGHQEDGRYVYRHLMMEDVRLIDPAHYVAVELYSRLARQRMLTESPGPDSGSSRGEFYITVPNPLDTSVKLNLDGWFAHEYKYGRDDGLSQPEVRTVPLVPERVDAGTRARLARTVPCAWGLLREFAQPRAPD